MGPITIHVRESQFTGGDHVVVFDADVLLLPHDATIAVTLTGVHPAYDRDPEGEQLALDCIRDGIMAVLATRNVGALVEVSNLVIHPVDFRPSYFRRYTVRHLEAALADVPLIRPAEVEDVAALSELARATYAAAFGHSLAPEDLTEHLDRHLSQQSFARALVEDGDVILLALVGGRIVGCVQFGTLREPTAEEGADRELRRLYVDVGFQGRGIGTALVEAALRHPLLAEAPRVVLDVWEHNPGAQRLYRRFGFEVVGERCFEVASGAPTSLDLIMERRAP